MEDIERDNLASERIQKSSTKQKYNLPNNVKLQYGFVPMKDPPITTSTRTSQPQYQIQYQIQPQYQYYNPQEYSSQYSLLAQQQQSVVPQQSVQQQLVQHISQTQSPQHQTAQHQATQYQTTKYQAAQQQAAQQQAALQHAALQQAALQQAALQQTAQHQAAQQQAAQHQAAQQQIAQQQIAQYQIAQQPTAQYPIAQHASVQQYPAQQYQYVHQPISQSPKYTSQQYKQFQRQPEGQSQKGTQQYQYQQPYYTTKADNLQNIIDNHLQNYLKQSDQQYVPAPQYVYVQPNQEASTSIQNVVDPKGNLQYVTYLPLTQIAQGNFVQSDLTASHTFNVVPQALPTKGAAASQNSIQYEQPKIDYSQLQQTTEFQYKDSPTVEYTEDTTAQYEQTLPNKAPTTKYTTEQLQYPENQAKQVQIQKQVMLEIDFPKRKPQSLLESYVPSVLQYQYYKNQQAKLQQLLKNTQQSVGKNSAVKQQYVPTQPITYQHLSNYQNQK